MTEQRDFTRLPDQVTLDQTVAIEVDDDRWSGPGGGGGDLGVADGDGD